MKAKVFLLQIRKIDRIIENKLIEKAQWMQIATGTTKKIGRDRVQTSGSQQKMADAVDMVVDIEKEIDQYIDKLVEKKNDVIKVIEQLNELEYDLLHKMYVQYKTLDDLAVIYDKSYTWVTTMHGRALKDVQRILDGEENGTV